MPTASTAFRRARRGRLREGLCGSLIVEARIVKSDDEPVAINDLMHRDGDNWHIAEVYLDGTISELAVRRSRSSAILRDQSIAGLSAALNRKSDLLPGSAATAI